MNSHIHLTSIDDSCWSRNCCRDIIFEPASQLMMDFLSLKLAPKPLVIIKLGRFLGGHKKVYTLCIISIIWNMPLICHSHVGYSGKYFTHSLCLLGNIFQHLKNNLRNQVTLFYKIPTIHAYNEVSAFVGRFV